MKTIFFIRHAKSSWDQPGVSDRDRPLNERGLRDAPFMSKMLAGKGFRLDHIVSSPATRAFTTAVYFAKAFGIPQEHIEINRNISRRRLQCFKAGRRIYSSGRLD